MARQVPLFETADLMAEGVAVIRVAIHRPRGVTRALEREMTDWLEFDPTPNVRYSWASRDQVRSPERGGAWASFHITDPNVALAFKMRFG